jgi:hypothetical protein
MHTTRDIEGERREKRIGVTFAGFAQDCSCKHNLEKSETLSTDCEPPLLAQYLSDRLPLKGKRDKSDADA